MPKMPPGGLSLRWRTEGYWDRELAVYTRSVVCPMPSPTVSARRSRYPPSRESEKPFTQGQYAPSSPLA